MQRPHLANTFRLSAVPPSYNPGSKLKTASVSPAERRLAN
jgi:hypothetical protein